jgi:hypothetical protein
MSLSENRVVPPKLPRRASSRQFRRHHGLDSIGVA